LPLAVRYFFLVGAGEGVAAATLGAAAGTAADEVGRGVGTGVGVAAGACVGSPDCSTELVPVMNGSDRHRANNMNAAAAPIVIFDSSVCVPRGPKAVLDTELENNAPASALPGCKSTESTKMTHERINNP